jgi:hypothetical protein
MRRWGWILLGGGCGVAAGAMGGPPAIAPGVVAAVVGLCLLAAGRSGGANLVEDATAGHTPAAGVAGKKAPEPALEGLGRHVEGILTLAEEQAADMVATAKAEAAQILAQARAEARRIEAD